MRISSKLKDWYQVHQRSLPWRETTDPYKVWLSEIILQQTRVNQGIPYYYKFLEHFPTITDLAKASPEKVMKLWQGLGYYTRARNLHQTSKIVVKEHSGVFPSDYQAIINLPGIGVYAAAAISSFCFGGTYPVVDGNVIRFLSRLSGITEPIDKGEGKRQISELAEQCMDKQNPALYNQAIMEFGALQCKPSNPDCNNCPFKQRCVAYNQDLVAIIPVKLNKTKITNRYFNYLLVKHKASIFINKRGSGDIWQNLYDLPLIETAVEISAEKIIASSEWEEFFGESDILIESVSNRKAHKLSHQNIHARIFEIRLNTPPDSKFKSRFKKIKISESSDYPVPKIIELVFEEKLENYLISS